MWSRHKKLKEWVSAGLLAESQAQAIESYEQIRKSGRFGRGLVHLSIFAILVGVLSIIASNWYKIPGEVKIGVHLLLNIGVGLTAFWADRKGKELWREGAALAFIGLTLTLIILVGQVYQLTGNVAGATMLWMAITLPFFLLMGRTYATAVPWMIAFLVTLCFAVEEYVTPLSAPYDDLFYIGIPALLPLALMADGALDIFRRFRPALADVFLKTGCALSAFFASTSLIVTYIGHYSKEFWVTPSLPLAVLATGLVAIALHAVVYGFYKNRADMKYASLFALVSLLVFIAPFFGPGFGGTLFGALVFITYWVFIGWIAQNAGYMRVVSLAISLIAIRIFFIYVEIFGSLMSTGIGLIVGGVVMLGLIYAARKLNGHLRAKGKLHDAL